MKHVESFEEFNILNESIIDIYKNKDILKEITTYEEAIKLIDNNNYEFKFMDYLISIDINKLTMGILKLTPKGKYLPYKVIQHYRYSNVDRIKESIKRFIDNENSFISRKQKEKENKKTYRQEMKNPFKIGDILYDSWGYEQTNIDFYQVTNISDKSVWIREISSEMVPGTQGHDSSNVRPLKDHFIGEEIRKPLIVTSYSKTPYISSKHGSISLYTSGDDGVYSSWGY
jgi:hypothetical protein